MNSTTMSLLQPLLEGERPSNYVTNANTYGVTNEFTNGVTKGVAMEDSVIIDVMDHNSNFERKPRDDSNFTNARPSRHNNGAIPTSKSYCGLTSIMKTREDNLSLGNRRISSGTKKFVVTPSTLIEHSSDTSLPSAKERRRSVISKRTSSANMNLDKHKEPLRLHIPDHHQHTPQDTINYPSIVSMIDPAYERVSSRKGAVSLDAAWLGRFYARRDKPRLIHQSGEYNMTSSNVHRRSMRYLNDLFTTLLELEWRYNIIIYLSTFSCSWIIFALLWWGLHVANGYDDRNIPCVEGVTDFKTALLFSIETQHTIGYGSRSITDRCALGFVLIMLQCLFGTVTQCVVTGVIFSKLARPSSRKETVMFSKNAVICCRKSYLSLEFRVADVRNSQLIGVRMNAVLVRKVLLCNGKQIDLQQFPMKITTESEDDFYFLAWPIKIIHRIDKSSPLWNISPERLPFSDFEILVVLEATCEATGGTIQVTTSYLPAEVMWGYRLAPLLTHQRGNGQYKVDYSQFNKVVCDEIMHRTPMADEEDECNLFDSFKFKDKNLSRDSKLPV